MTKDELPVEKRTRCEVWTRVMGYHRPVHNWNQGKQSEHRERKYFKEDACSVDFMEQSLQKGQCSFCRGPNESGL